MLVKGMLIKICISP